MKRRRLKVETESWPILGAFAIARGAKTEARVVTVQISEDEAIGRGECVPYARYGESPDSVRVQIESIRGAIESGLDRLGLLEALPRGAARNALDCALWDLEAKRTGEPVWRLAGLPEPGLPVTAFTISLGPPDSMALAARAAAHRPLLKIKLGDAEQDLDRVLAVREAAPKSRLIADVNEGWTPNQLAELAPKLAALKVDLIEQPLLAAADSVLDGFRSPVPLCADESCHGPEELPVLARRYKAVNLKLDKTGGLTEALEVARIACDLGLDLMVGCMVATSLSMAPALLLAGLAQYVDLDGPLLLERDRDPGLRYEPNGTVAPAPRELWG